MDIRTTPLATISGHAVSRWFERSGSRDHAKLVSDLTYILGATEPDRVVIPSGAWLGSIIRGHVAVNGEDRCMPIRTIRTYLAAGMIEFDRAPFAKLEAVA